MNFLCSQIIRPIPSACRVTHLSRIFQRLPQYWALDCSHGLRGGSAICSITRGASLRGSMLMVLGQVEYWAELREKHLCANAVIGRSNPSLDQLQGSEESNGVPLTLLPCHDCVLVFAPFYAALIPPLLSSTGPVIHRWELILRGQSSTTAAWWVWS